MDPDYPNVFNLGQVPLSNSEKQLLSRGLKFCPDPGPVKNDVNEQAISDLIRKIHIQAAFLNNQGGSTNQVNAQQTLIQKHKPKSNWKPQNEMVPQSVRDFTDELQEQLRKEPARKTNIGNNLSHREKIALKKLRKRTDIIIKPADKGSGVCILTTEQYKNEVLRQLNNPHHYRKIEEDTTPQVAKLIKEVISKYIDKGLIHPKMAEIIIPNPFRPARFYTIPKVHKGLVNPPGRPIMGACAHPTERLSEYVDLELNPHVKTITSYIKDTNHLIEILEAIDVPPNAKLVTFDVTALYTNIPHEEQLKQS